MILPLLGLSGVCFAGPDEPDYNGGDNIATSVNSSQVVNETTNNYNYRIYKTVAPRPRLRCPYPQRRGEPTWGKRLEAGQKAANSKLDTVIEAQKGHTMTLGRVDRTTTETLDQENKNAGSLKDIQDTLRSLKDNQLGLGPMAAIGFLFMAMGVGFVFLIASVLR